jgi:hypothetical protein
MATRSPALYPRLILSERPTTGGTLPETKLYLRSVYRRRNYLPGRGSTESGDLRSAIYSREEEDCEVEVEKPRPFLDGNL